KYQGRYMMGWNELRRQRHKRQIEMGLLDPQWPLSGEDSQSYSWEGADQEWEDLRMAVYAAMVDCMDQNIGRLLAALRELELEQNTLVVFLSDNGGCSEEPGGRDTSAVPGQKEDYTAVGPAWGWAQNTPFRRYKSWVHEGGISTPLIVRWPGVVEPGAMSDQVGHIIDFMPTLADLAGAEYPQTIDGREILPVEGKSLTPVLRGEERSGHAQLCWEWSGNRAVRQGKWKLVWDKLVRRWELYDLEADRTETADLAEKHPDRARAMAEAWEAWAEETGVKKG
ncbi:MAG: sulfatase-like hydrolase/transferase, partial [Planctomycetes bacterium]|nr:sulfatase-like hydrolase/transferase [Planctomycetota bacterium]